MAALQPLLARLPTLDRGLEAMFGGTSFLHGDFAADYTLALGIGLCFPLVRWLLDRTVYEVRAGGRRCRRR